MTNPKKAAPKKAAPKKAAQTQVEKTLTERVADLKASLDHESPCEREILMVIKELETSRAQLLEQIDDEHIAGHVQHVAKLHHKDPADCMYVGDIIGGFIVKVRAALDD